MLDDLNPQQQAAVTTTDGPILILAGAGSGKTRVLTYRVAYLIKEKKISPHEILMVTFTNKAAHEMKLRMKKLLHTDSNIPFAGTFHALCAKLLRIDGKEIGISPQFVIYDPQDQKDLIKTILTDLNLSIKQYNPNAILGTISSAKNELLTPEQYAQYARGPFQEVVSTVYRRYQEQLQKNQALDFDDLLMSTIDLLTRSKAMLAKYSTRFRYVLVDEYQDTNQAQYTLTKLLSSHWGNVAVVGDASQSIYAWRGANFRNIVNFKTEFPNVKIFNLDQNYRSTQSILDAAFAVISKNTSHPILKLWTANPPGEKITIHEAYNEQHEALFVLEEMRKLKLHFSDVAILYRTNAQSRALEEVLLHEGIPYTLVGGQRFYERKEIKDVLAYLRLLINPADTVSEKRIENIGKKRAQQFYLYRDRTASSLEKTPTLELLDETLATTDYLSLYNDEEEEDRARLENIKELRSVASQFPNLSQFLENVALMEHEDSPDTSFKDETDRVTLMTMHGAKGLEFPAVFMVGMEEGLFPHSRTLFDREELEEERRLCYVGITRAKKHLYLTFTRQRLYFGSRTQNILSRFISEIPPALMRYTQESFE